MAWKRVKHPSEIVNVGDEITVKVLKFDRERTRVSLGLKQLGEDPWVAIAKRYPEGTKLTGRVTNLTDYGCFVEIEEGALKAWFTFPKWIGPTKTSTVQSC
ncbi:30S ribosomal protein S1 [Klebsiella pneumoniae subsp. ozaenae]|uniref:30S ribosomal protein S1 n=1 Tax=Klebsiella pneumoniae subsp. ozaenae TaxID=574 RepID=A0A378BNF8_KLEPO|nr:30S ribosomal protein S1 [Klebsiella pneumoniae subsp. ozaenae]